MSLDLFQEESSQRLTEFAPTQNPPANTFDGFMYGAGMATMRGFAKTGRAISLLGSVGAIAQDVVEGGSHNSDAYFDLHKDIFQKAVDYWTPKPNEVGFAGEAVGTLLSMVPQVIASPALAVGSAQLGMSEDLVGQGVSSGKAQAVGGIYGAGMGLGVWMPILGQNLWQRMVLGGAGFNVAQGVAMRGAAGAILDGDKAGEGFKAFSGEDITLDVLMGLAFGGIAHINPAARAQGAEAIANLKAWAEKWAPSDVAAIATLREAQHLNVDSTPGRPVAVQDIETHVQRMRTAIDQLATDKPVDVEGIKATIGDAQAEPRFTPDAERTAEAEATVRTLNQDAAAMRNEEGLLTPELRPYSDLFKFLDEYVSGKEVGVPVPNYRFDLGRFAPAVVAKVAQLIDGFGDKHAAVRVNARSLKHTDEGHASLMRDAYTRLPELLANAETEVLRNPKRPDSAFLVFSGGSKSTPLAIVEISKNGNGTDIVNVIPAKKRTIQRHREETAKWLEGRHGLGPTPHPVGPEGTPAEDAFSDFQPLDKTSVGQKAGDFNQDASGTPGENGLSPNPEAPPAAAGQAVSPPLGKSGERPAGAEGSAREYDPVRAEADLIVSQAPDMPITVGTNPDGTPMTMTAKDYMEQARMDTEQAMKDVNLLEVAAQCLLGVH